VGAPKRKASVVQREIAGETFLVPIHGHVADLQELFVVNEVGRFIWDRLDGGALMDELVSAVVGEFEVNEAQARLDAQSFLSRLQEAGLLEDQMAAEG
jgi:hypothetical protein